MSIVVSTALGNAILDSINTAINAGDAGKLEMATSTEFTTILATFTLNDPAFGAADAKALPLDVDPALTATVAVSGTAAAFRFLTSADVEVLRGSVGLAAADCIFDAVAWLANGVLTISAGSISIA